MPGREERERRYIADYCAHFFPRGGYILNVPLGPIPADIIARYGLAAGARLFRPSRPRIDAVLPTPEAYYLIEAKIREAKAAIGDLAVYGSLAPNTPDLPGYDGQPFALRLVVPWALDWVQEAAKANGMELIVYLPEWVEDYVRYRQNFFTREVRIAREERMRLRKLFGLE